MWLSGIYIKQIILRKYFHRADHHNENDPADSLTFNYAQ